MGSNAVPAWVATLRARPGRQAIVHTYPAGADVAAYARAKYIRQATTGSFAPRGSWDATVRKTSDGEYELYVTYLGQVAGD